MYRLLICFALCLFVAPNRPELLLESTAYSQTPFTQEPLPVSDILTFLAKGIERYDQQGIKGYTAMMRKQERVEGKLRPSEDIEVFFREKPLSVFMHWVRGQQRADSTLYVEGENGGKMLAKPAGVASVFVKVLARDVDGEDARQAGRYTMAEFGIKKGAERTLRDWKAIKEKGMFRAEYLGVRKVREVGDRQCYTIRRTCLQPEQDGILEVTVYIDKETWLQLGTVIKGEGGKLIGEYMFRDVKMNPEFKPNQFQKSALTS